MFDNLTTRLSSILRKITNRGRLTDDNIKTTLEEVRYSLLEADVALQVVNNIINEVKEYAIGKEINKSLTPGQEFIKIIKNKLIDIMGNDKTEINLAIQPPAVILMIGLQGVGKTTSIGKLAKFIKEKKKKKVIVVSTDIYRYAAFEQLEMIAKKINIDYFSTDIKNTPINIVQNALIYAKKNFYDVLIIDTAGRLHIDKIMIEEIKNIASIVLPIETLLVLDAITGQDAFISVKTFNDAISITGIILTKIDADSRGGAALSAKYITGKPIKFLSIGETPNDFEVFDPEKIASRILGMKDILSLIKEIENNNDISKIKNYIIKKENNFNINDFIKHIKYMKKIGGLKSILSKIPNIISSKINIKKIENDKIFLQMEAIINSMTLKERINPEIIKGKRKQRIAKGSGTKVQDVNLLLKQFFEMQLIMKKMKKNKGNLNINSLSNIINNIKNGI